MDFTWLGNIGGPLLGIGALFVWLLGGYLLMRSELPEPTRKMWALMIILFGPAGSLLFMLLEWPSQRGAHQEQDGSAQTPDRRGASEATGRRRSARPGMGSIPLTSPTRRSARRHPSLSRAGRRPA
jgi:hypothetical protein